MLDMGKRMRTLVDSPIRRSKAISISPFFKMPDLGEWRPNPARSCASRTATYAMLCTPCWCSFDAFARASAWRRPRRPRWSAWTRAGVAGRDRRGAGCSLLGVRWRLAARERRGNPSRSKRRAMRFSAERRSSYDSAPGHFGARPRSPPHATHPPTQTDKHNAPTQTSEKVTHQAWTKVTARTCAHSVRRAYAIDGRGYASCVAVRRERLKRAPNSGRGTESMSPARSVL